MLGNDWPPIEGESHESKMDNHYDEIKSKDINSLEYSHPDYFLKVEKQDNKLKVVASGGYSNQRDGKYFRIVLETEDFNILKKLQQDIEKYDISKDNGHCLYVDGLPGGLGDTINVQYESGESIYKTSNQGMTISEEASKALYNTFHKYIKKFGLDFNSKGSNVPLYDDADEEYIQGTWNGKHFGENISVTFKENNVQIKVNDKITDDEEYTIVEGTIIANRIKEGIDKPKDEHDYEHFKGVSCFAKKNKFTITGYFLEDSYSTCDLMNFDKEK